MGYEGAEHVGIGVRGSERRDQADEAYPGDIIGLHNHGTIQIGDSFTEETVKNSEARADEESLAGEALPEISGTEPVKGAAAEAAPEKSVWGRVKGWFSQ